MSKVRSYLCTWNNPKDGVKEELEKLYTSTGAQYLIGQLEKGEEGTPHFQFVVNFKAPQRISKFKGYPIHAEPIKRDNGTYNYVTKEETRIDGPWEFGVKPVQRNNKQDWDEVFEHAKKGDFDAIPSDIKVKHYQNLVRIRKDNMVVQDADHLRGIWIYGKAGIGKSRKAREDYPGSYPKLCNKWWDGYKEEKSVIMDDIGKEHSVLGQQLKIWSDRYGCILETKGGAVPSAYDWFIVTSQYSIDEIWEDYQTREALHRRFKVIHMSEPFPERRMERPSQPDE